MLFGANRNALGWEVFGILAQTDAQGVKEWEGPMPGYPEETAAEEAKPAA